MTSTKDIEVITPPWSFERLLLCGVILNPQQVLPGAKVAVESEALRDLVA